MMMMFVLGLFIGALLGFLTVLLYVTFKEICQDKCDMTNPTPEDIDMVDLHKFFNQYND